MREISTILAAQPLTWVRGDWSSGHQGKPTFVIFDVSPADPAIKGLAMVVKNPRGKPTDSQLTWARTMDERGYCTRFVYDASDAREVVLEFMAKRKLKGVGS